ncbi:MAG: hypothetical protein JXA11_02785 [Phycisphaerae bacterium]|nr:hypothetical protein [Phycisphaerae bacterium]
MVRTWCWIVIGVVAAGVASGCSTSRKNQQADATTDVVLKLLDAGQVDSLYENYTTESFRQANRRDDVSKLAKGLHEYLGAPEKHSLVQYRIRTFEGRTEGDYLYKVIWAKDEGTLRLGLVWQNGGWKIHSLDIQSPAIDPARKDKPKEEEKPKENKPKEDKSQEDKLQENKSRTTGETIHI